jgi:hypothetical protein
MSQITPLIQEVYKGRPFGFPARFADFGVSANSLRSNNALPFFRSRLHGSATPKAIKIKIS